MQKNNDSQGLFTYGWLLVAAVPLAVISFSYLLGSWSWGLMDDFTILNSGRGIIQRTFVYYNALYLFGLFRPVHVIFSTIFYTLFEKAPNLLYLFKLLIVALILWIWGRAACRITKQKISLFLVPAIALSFHYFYDTMFYLSTHEFFGMFFTGLAMHSFLNGIQGRFRWSSWMQTFFFLLCAFASKETFVSCGVAFAAAYAYAWKAGRKPEGYKLLAAGVITLALTAAYAFILKGVIQTCYSSAYVLNNPSKIAVNLASWLKKDVVNHSPWLLGILLAYSFGRRSFMSRTFEAKAGLLLGVLLYLAFLAILLPWNTIAYYAAPFGLFFAFVTALLISEELLKLRERAHMLVIALALALNIFVCQYALIRESTYQYDTVNLMHSLEKNFSLAGQKGSDYIVLCNAVEAAVGIPRLTGRNSGISIRDFIFSTDINEKIGGRSCDFYLYSPRFYGVDTRQLKGWEAVFLSKNWILYKRPQ